MSPESGDVHELFELELEFPAKPEFVGTARHAVSALVRLRDLPDDVVQDVKLAVSEACTTAINVDSGRGSGISLSASVGPDRVIVEVIDPGTGVERSITGVPSEIDTDELPFERALSLPIIRGLVDEVAITPIEGRGTSLRMVLSASRDDLDGQGDA